MSHYREKPWKSLIWFQDKETEEGGKGGVTKRKKGLWSYKHEMLSIGTSLSCYPVNGNT